LWNSDTEGVGMRKIESKSSLIESRHEVQGKVGKLLRDLSLSQKLTMLKASDILAELPPSQRRAALHIIKQRNKYAEVDFAWLASFLKVLKALKAEENRMNIS
jgi:hypothetical protein